MNSIASTALGGIQRAERTMLERARDVARPPFAASDGPTAPSAPLDDGPDYVRDFVDIKAAQIQMHANARVIQLNDEMTRRVIDLLG